MKTERIEGRYEFVANPCTTRPCLPGMALAVRGGERDYFLTVDGRLMAEARSWQGYAPEPGDRVAVTGEVRSHRDVFDKPYQTLEVTTLEAVGGSSGA